MTKKRELGYIGVSMFFVFVTYMQTLYVFELQKTINGCVDLAVKANAMVYFSSKQQVMLEAAHKELMQARLADYIRKVKPKAPAKRLAKAFMESADKYKLDVVWFVAQAEQESAFNPMAEGDKGERGIMQIRESTAQTLGLPWNKAHNVELNIDAAARYLSTHLKKYGEIERALKRYNGGNPDYPRLVKARHTRVARYLGDDT